MIELFSRRSYTALLLCLYLIAAASCSKAPDHSAAKSAKPRIRRIILITIDTLRADALSVYGNHTNTPFFEGFAKRSVLFENAVTCVPITLPAHTSLLTGLYPPSHGVRNNGTFRAPQGLDLLSKYAKQNQFLTGAVIGGFPLASSFGLNQGFDFYDDEFLNQPGTPGTYLYAEKNAEQVRKSAEDWISKHAGNSFFLWLHFFDPHHPYVDHGLTGVSPYEQEVLYVDKQLGMLFQYLRSKKLDDQALVILTADHGEAFGEHGEISHSVFIYNTTLRIPLLISAPGIAPARKTELARIIDIAPTVLDFLQWKPKSQMDGTSLRNLMQGKKEESRDSYAETLAPALDFEWSPLLSIQDLHSKFILAPHSEFYDLKTDPSETKNLIAQTDPGPYQKKIKTIVSRQPLFKNTEHKSTPEEREQLESLGYISGNTNEIHSNGPDPKDRVQVARAIAELTGNVMSLPQKEQAYRSIVKEEPSNPLLLLRYGEILLKLQKYSEAEKVFQRVLDLEYPHPDTYNGLAAVYFYQNQLAKAEAILNQAVKLNVADGETYYNLAEFYFNKGDSDKAMNLYDRSIQLGFLPAFFRKARLLEVKGETKPAFELLQKAETLAPGDARVNEQRGMIYIRHRQFPEAIKEFEAALQKNPDEKQLLYNIGFCYYRLEDKEKAREYLKEFLKLGSVITKEEHAAAEQMLNN